MSEIERLNDLVRFWADNSLRTDRVDRAQLAVKLNDFCRVWRISAEAPPLFLFSSPRLCIAALRLAARRRSLIIAGRWKRTLANLWEIGWFPSDVPEQDRQEIQRFLKFVADRPSVGSVTSCYSDVKKDVYAAVGQYEQATAFRRAVREFWSRHSDREFGNLQVRDQIHDLAASEILRTAPQVLGLTMPLLQATLNSYQGVRTMGGPLADFHHHEHMAVAHDLLTSAYWFQITSGCVIACDRPVVAIGDADGRFHSSERAAVRFADGFEVHVWHGLALPKHLGPYLVNPDRISTKLIFDQEDLAVRQALCEISQWRPIRDQSYEIASDVDVNGRRRTLFEAIIAFDEGLNILTRRFVVVENGSLEPDGTRRSFALSVGPGRTPHEVIAASYGLNPDRYAEAVRT